MDHLVGVPYVPGGRDLFGTDCWGLVRIWFMEQGILLPSYDGDELTNDHYDLQRARSGSGPWISIDSPEYGALGLWKRSRNMMHAGVMVGPGLVLHNDSLSRGSAVQRVRDVIGGRPEWYRHEDFSL